MFLHQTNMDMTFGFPITKSIGVSVAGYEFMQKCYSEPVKAPFKIENKKVRKKGKRKKKKKKKGSLGAPLLKEPTAIS